MKWNRRADPYRVRKWRSFVKQTEIRLGLDESYRELQTRSMRFNIVLHLDASNRSRELEDIRKRDHDELTEVMTRVLHDNGLLEIALVYSILEDAHKILHVRAGVEVGERRREFREDFGKLRE